MTNQKAKSISRLTALGTTGLCMAAVALSAGAQGNPRNACKDLPGHAVLQQALSNVVDSGGNAGLGNDMWGTVVNRDGVVCAVVFSGNDRGEQWLGSRVISAQKANTANAFSLNSLALSTANLYEPTQPGNSLFGLQHSNPVDTGTAYGGNGANYGQPNDPMVGGKIGGVNVFGGGLPLYDEQGKMVGAVGVSGDTSCTDHIIAWKVRDQLELDTIPGGVAPTGTDNMILGLGTSGFGHPACGFGEEAIIPTLPVNFPTGPNS